MRHSYLFTVIALTALVVPAHAQLTTYTSLASFQAAAPVTTLEDFSNGVNLTSGSAAGPIDKTTSNLNFSPGAIVDGLRLDFPGIAPDEYFYSSVYGLPLGITTNYGSNSLNIFLYNNDANAVGFDLSNTDVGGGDYTITAFDTLGAQIGSSFVFDPAGVSFFGITSAGSNIGHVNLEHGIFETVGNIRFGTSSISASAPEPTTVALLGLALVPGVLAARRRRN